MNAKTTFPPSASSSSRLGAPACEIAIVGVSALFPGSVDATGFWRDILAGRDLLSDVPNSHWRIDDYFDPDPSAPDKTYAKRGGFLSPIDFDALDWGIPPSMLSATDTSQLLALIVARSVLQDAARDQFESMDRSRISVILGVTSAQELLFSMVSRLQRPVWVKALRESGLGEDEVQAACERIAAHYVPWQEASFPGLLGNVVAGRIANRLNLGGTNCVTDAACASSFSAVAMGVSELQLGASDLVIAGGVDTLNDIFMYMCFSKTPALSPSGDCRPFSDQADGTMLGEGLGMVALKRLADAERDGDRIYAVLRAVGTSSDGRSKSVYAPVSAGQAQALRRSYAQAGFSAATIELVEAHGTGTKAGDAAEFGGLETVYREADAERKQWCALGSVKSQIGHTKAAAGAAGLFKAVMALHHKVLPPTIKVDSPNPQIQIEQSPFYLNTQARPWIRGSDHPRRAAVSAFGFGGSNFHLCLEEYTGTAPRAERLPTHPTDLVLLSAKSADELVSKIQAIADDQRPLAWIARDSRADWENGANFRLALVSTDRANLAEQLGKILPKIQGQPKQSFSLPDGCSYGAGAADGKLALLFPGQGSQYVGMGADLAMQFEAARAVWERAADLPLDPNETLQQRVFPLPAFDPAGRAAQEQRLTATQWTQPALAAHSASLLALLRQFGIQADMHAGHSFGELMALHAAGAFDESRALQLAQARGAVMAAASEEAGAMTAISATREQVLELLAKCEPAPVLANHNGPKQVVVSGPLAAIESFESQASAAGLNFRRLPVSSAFHSSLVSAASSQFRAALKPVKIPPLATPVYANSSAAPYPADCKSICAQLAEQLSLPVRFVEMIEAMYAAGARQFVEVGPGSVLCGLVGAILGDRPHSAVALDRKGKHGVTSLLQGLARLAADGVPIDPDSLYDDVRLPEPASIKMKMPVAISGSNHGKPYPPADPTALPPPNPTRVVEARQVSAQSDVTPAAAPHRSVQNGAAIPARSIGTVTTAPAQAPSAPTTLSPKAPMPNSPKVSSDWLAAFQQSQDQAAQAHQDFQRAMADSHNAYLRLAESALQGLSAAIAGSEQVPAAATRGTQIPAPTTQVAAPLQASMSASASAAQTATASARARDPFANSSMSAVSLESPKKASPPAPPTQLADPAPLSAQPSALSPKESFDLPALLLAVVAEKTGFPPDMLNLEMDLEADLGVDSIKRVEILATLDERAPHLPKVDRSRLTALHTLAEIIAYLESAGAVKPPASAATLRAPEPAPLSPQPSALSPDLPALLLAVVAEKTGFPPDMLNLDMDLEADLGVDSIKRVEILATLDERAPHLPKVDRSRLTALHTLAEIIDYLNAAGASSLPATAAMPRVAEPAPLSPQPSALSPDLPALLLAVVAEKTGFPPDMLNLDMDLEADLGVDSIKRVEILATLDERAPHLPKVDRSRLTALHTLAEIIAYLESAEAAATPATSATTRAAEPAPLSSQPSALSPKETFDLSALLLAVVAEKTGFPPDMLNLDMDLEADLGVDSIKRVEILATLDERAPHLPKVDRSRLTALHTLAEIIAYLESAGAVKPPASAATLRAPEPAPLSPQPSALSPDKTLSPGPDLARYTLEPTPAPATGFAMPGLLSGQQIWVIGPEDPGQALAAELTGRGVDAKHSEELPADANACIYLGGLAAVSDSDAAMAINHQAFALARQLASRLETDGGLLVTVQDTGGNFGLTSAAPNRSWLAGLPALIKTCALEWPQAALKAIDIACGPRDSAAVATALADELLLGGGEIEISLGLNGTRRSLRSVATKVVAEAEVVEPGDVIVVSGGARGVTAACVIEWAGRCRGSFVLLGRTELQPEPEACRGVAADGLQHAIIAAAKASGESITPAQLSRQVNDVLAIREVRQTLSAVEAKGASARYAAVSVDDEPALAVALQQVRDELGPIRGIVHAAGVLADKRIAEKTDAQFAQVFNTKVLGLRALLAVTADDPLKLLCVYSSVSARCGNTGQADYAMANEVLNKVAQAQLATRPQLRVKALAWGPWEGGMVNPALRQRFAELGVPMIPLSVGARMFADEMADGKGAVELVLGGEPRPQALLAAGAEGRVDALELRVARLSHEYLAGHAVNGQPVVPVVLVAEWLTRAARSFRPGLAVLALHDLRVLKGIPLPGFENGGDLLRIEARPLAADQGQQLQMSVLDAKGRPRYSARVELDAQGPSTKLGLPELHLEDWGDQPLYQDLLFHRGSFELIDHVAGVSDQGIRAQLRGVAATDWPQDGWQLDVAALDGGMQLAVLYGQRMLGGPNLPTSIGMVRNYPRIGSAGPITATAYSRLVGSAATTTDIVLTDANGKRFAELLGVQNHVLPAA